MKFLVWYTILIFTFPVMINGTQWNPPVSDGIGHPNEEQAYFDPENKAIIVETGRDSVRVREQIMGDSVVFIVQTKSISDTGWTTLERVKVKSGETKKISVFGGKNIGVLIPPRNSVHPVDIFIKDECGQWVFYEFKDKVNPPQIASAKSESEDPYSFRDVIQGLSCHCDFLSTLSGVLFKRGSETLRKRIRFKNGKFLVRLFDTRIGKWTWVQSGFDGTIKVGDPVNYENIDNYRNENGWHDIWPVLFQRAWMCLYDLPYQCAKCRGEAEEDPDKALAWTMENAYETLTGRKAETAELTEDKSEWKDESFVRISNAINRCYVVMAGTLGHGEKVSSPLINCHCYMIKSVNTDDKSVILYNPHGTELTISWEAFSRNFNKYTIGTREAINSDD